MKKMVYLMIHCTATPEGREITRQDIIRLHTSPPPTGRGWKQVGYSDMIHLSGVIENLVKYNDDDYVDPREITNGHAGINGITRHVVYVGGTDKQLKPKDTRTAKQKLALENYVKQTIAQHPDIIVCGHNQMIAKACPSFNVPEWLMSINVAEKNIFKQ
jgi:hypothetical protein